MASPEEKARRRRRLARGRKAKQRKLAPWHHRPCSRRKEHRAAWRRRLEPDVE